MKRYPVSPLAFQVTWGGYGAGFLCAGCRVLQRQLTSKFQMVFFTKLVSYTRISHAAIIRHGCFLVRLASNTTLK